MSLFKMIFSWWNSATWGTLLTTWLSGSSVGTDDFGKRYYQNKDGSRRWVIRLKLKCAGIISPCADRMPNRFL